MPNKNTETPVLSAEIDGKQHSLVDLERLSILAEALGEAKLIELSVTARQSILESAEELRLNWRQGDTHAAGRSAHRLVGVAANFGWPALALIAGNIERACHNGDDSGRYSRQFEEVLAASLAALPFSSGTS